MPRSVLITGASTGIGEALAHDLAGRDWQVFAGVRRPDDGERVRAAAPDRIRWVRLDVTDGASVTAALEEVGRTLGAAPLNGLVNNAGIVVGGPLEYLPLDGLRHQFEVNVIGLVAVTQAALPLLRRGPGRIVNIGSISGRVATPMVGPYSASKFAVEALSDALRMELAPWGIHTAVIEPGVVATPIWDKGTAYLEQVARALPPEGLTGYEVFLRAFRRMIGGASKRAVPMRRVVRAVTHALEARRPRVRYLVGRDARVRLAAQTLLPRRWMDAIVLRVLRQVGR